jgi:hypothetical protein
VFKRAFVSLCCWQQARNLPTAVKERDAAIAALNAMNRDNRDVIIDMITLFIARFFLGGSTLPDI